MSGEDIIKLQFIIFKKLYHKLKMKEIRGNQFTIKTVW